MSYSGGELSGGQIVGLMVLAVLACIYFGILPNPLASGIPAASIPAATVPAASVPAATVPAASAPVASVPVASVPAVAKIAYQYPTITDVGHSSATKGWYDVQGLGGCYDYCRYVGDNDKDWFSCLLADPKGTPIPTKIYTDKGVYTEAGLQTKLCSVVGQYITLTQPSVGCLNLAEIQVFSPGLASLENIASTATITASSLHGLYPMQNLVDGNLNNFAHTSCGDAPTVTMDFGKPVKISIIKIFNRTDCCFRRANGIVVKVLDASKNEVYKANALGDTAGNTSFIESAYGPSYKVFTFYPPNPTWIGTA